MQLHKNPQLLTAYASNPATSMDKASIKALLDYCKRVLSKLSPESEDEKEAFWKQFSFEWWCGGQPLFSSFLNAVGKREREGTGDVGLKLFIEKGKQ